MKINISKILTAVSLILSAASCSNDGPASVKVKVSNGSDIDRTDEMVEIPVSELRGTISNRYFYVLDSKGREIPSQVTHDSLLIFKVTLAPDASSRFTVCGSDTVHAYRKVVGGRVYPERADDLAWENETAGYRIYGPGTRMMGEHVYGNDVFFKYPTSELVLEKIYATQTDTLTQNKIDSLKRSGYSATEEYYNSVSYHVNHGLGMDCYLVGPTLGVGGLAIFRGDSLAYTCGYETAEILDNGPIRFTARVSFISPAGHATEWREITLDSNARLNRCKAWFEDLDEPVEFATGFPRRDDCKALSGEDMRWLSYSDPTQGPDNGKALVGLVFMKKADRFAEADNHILAIRHTEPGDTSLFLWGAAWQPVQVKSAEDWADYLDNTDHSIRSPLKVEVKK